MTVGCSPKQLYGWRARTFYHYDAAGRVVSSETESPWEDPYEIAVVDAYLDWEANLHVCGRPMSESLEGADASIDVSSYVVGTRICLACMALEKHRAARAVVDAKNAGKSQENPDRWRLDQVDLLSEARQRVAAQNVKVG